MKTQNASNKGVHRTAAYISVAAWCAVGIMVAALWYWLNNAQMPQPLVNRVDPSKVVLWGHGVGMLLAGALYVLAVAAVVKLGRALNARKAMWISFGTGNGIAIMLGIMWWVMSHHGKIALTTSVELSRITLCLCPSSMMLIGEDSQGSLLGRIILYATVLLLNGALYALVALVIVKLARTFGKSGAEPGG
jgi:hypothetical protein